MTSADRYRVRTKLIGACASLAGLAGLVVAAPQEAAASAAGARADRHAVRSGDARFEVLSPTLIRMEYAGDGKFTDAATFNAIGRDDFKHTAFTHKVSGGWLTIGTDRLTLRYKVGSGPFTAQNVSLSLRGGVTAHPSWPALRIAPVRGTYKGQVTDRQWTAVFTDAGAPRTVRINGANAPAGSWKYDANRRTLTVTAATRSVRAATTISYG